MRAPKYIVTLKRIMIIAHSGQKYGDRPYHEHVMEVVNETKAILNDRGIMDCDPDYWFYIGVAFGHDLIEDTDITCDKLIHKGIPIEVVSGINSITHNKGESGEDYINRVILDKYSHLVKQADSLRNLTWSIRAGSQRRIKKYTKYLTIMAK
jgi:hypothetical protein